MHITTTAKDIIEKIEEAMVRQASYNIPIEMYIAESLLEITKDGKTVEFRLREFDKKSKKAHLNLMKAISNNANYDEKVDFELDNFGRPFTVKDMTEEEFSEGNTLANEVIDYFKEKL
jgi:ABC-type oligopeptide transport system substrate-binding subunit